MLKFLLLIFLLIKNGDYGAVIHYKNKNNGHKQQKKQQRWWWWVFLMGRFYKRDALNCTHHTSHEETLKGKRK